MEQSNSKEAIEYLQGLLYEEKQEDISQYNQMILQVNLKDRARLGTAWYPLQIKETGYGLGEQPFVVLERNEQENRGHKFGAGKMVNLFSNQAGIDEPHVKGIVNFVHKNVIKIFLYSNDFPDWLDMGKIGLDLLYDDRSYKEMEKALKLVLEAERNRLAHFREIFKGDKKVEFTRIKKPYFSHILNDSQNDAITKIMEAEDVAVVHGPPGTGKTTTIVEAIRLLSMEGNKVLATAPSNTAVDWLSLKLSQAGLNVVRVGNPSRIDKNLIDLTLEIRLFNSSEAKEIKRMKKQAEDCRKKARKYKRSFGPKEREERKALNQEARELQNQVKIIESYLTDKILSEADIVTSTLVGSNNRYIEHRRFDVVVIDEAAQALEPATWIAIAKADKKVVLAGDPFQLPPTVKSTKADKAGFSQTLIEQCLTKMEQVCLLNTQYRMNEKIMGFSNTQFYEDELKADHSVRYQTLELKNDQNQAIEFIDTAGCGFEEKKNPKSKSLYNPDEYTVLWRHLDTLIHNVNPDRPPNIGIISPYREQVLYMTEQVQGYFDFAGNIPIDINTIDSFQGQERDIIYISLVRCNDNGEIGFLKDTRRMNVAMTRARKKLVIIGDSATLGRHPFYSQLLEYCEKHEGYRSAWEFM